MAEELAVFLAVRVCQADVQWFREVRGFVEQSVVGIAV